MGSHCATPSKFLISSILFYGLRYFVGVPCSSDVILAHRNGRKASVASIQCKCDTNQTYILRLTYKVERDYMFHFWEGFLDFHNIIYLYMYPLLFQDIKGTFPVIFMNGYKEVTS